MEWTIYGVSEGQDVCDALFLPTRARTARASLDGSVRMVDIVGLPQEMFRDVLELKCMVARSGDRVIDVFSLIVLYALMHDQPDVGTMALVAKESASTVDRVHVGATDVAVITRPDKAAVHAVAGLMTIAVRQYGPEALSVWPFFPCMYWFAPPENVQECGEARGWFQAMGFGNVTTQLLLGAYVRYVMQSGFTAPVTWHLPGDFDHGYCYLSVIAPGRRNQVQMAVGMFPPIRVLGNLPLSWCDRRALSVALVEAGEHRGSLVDAISSYYVATKQRTVPGTLGYYCDSVGTTVVFATSSQDKIGSTEDALPVYAPAPRDWHIDVDMSKMSRQCEEGYCYVFLFRHKMREQLKKRIGPWPTLGQLVNMPPEIFMAWQTHMHRPLVSADGRAHGYVFDMLHYVASVMNNLREGSWGHRLINRFHGPPKKLSEPYPSPFDRLGGRKQLAALLRPRWRVDMRPVDDVSAERVFDRVCTRWAIVPSQQDAVVDALTDVFLRTTCRDAMYRTSIAVDGRELSCSELADAATEVVGRKNAVRLWARSFRSGLFVEAIYKRLANPENLGQRAFAFMHYHFFRVEFCFDMAKYIPPKLVPRKRVVRTMRIACYCKFTNSQVKRFPDLEKRRLRQARKLLKYDMLYANWM